MPAPFLFVAGLASQSRHDFAQIASNPERTGAFSATLNPRFIAPTLFASIVILHRTSLCLISALALGAAFQPAQAGDEEAVAAADEANFDTAFAPFAVAPATSEETPNAVDLSAIEPPVDGTARSLGRGMASYYGKRFAGRRTASGETFDPKQLTAAHRTLPFGSLVQVTNPANGRSVVVRINDRGPFAKSRVIDLSRRAAEDLDLVRAGHGIVELALIED